MNNLKWQNSKIDYKERCKILGQSGKVFWFTGLSGSGKSTLVMEIEKLLFAKNKICYVLDGDNIRQGLNNDLGFSYEERFENIRRISEVAKLFQEAGLIVLVSFITPLEKMRELARTILKKANYKEIYVKCSVDCCLKRDPKGLYEKAKKGLIKNFTGISSVYEEPENSNLIIDTEKLSLKTSVNKLLDFIENNI
jgi:adenylylsulfate kinase